MVVRLAVVDAFTDRAFSGNPAGVCLLDEPVDETWMQAVASELHLSETAFLSPAGDGYLLRWFTPTTEVPLCGHATLASAHLLWEDGQLAPGAAARFTTRSGVLIAHRTPDGIAMAFPRRPVVPVDAPADLIAGLGLGPVTVAGDADTYLIELPDESSLRALAPDTERLAGLTCGVIVTSPSSAPEYDFVSRYFAPGIGIPEDPVTGAAHCSLGPWWQARLGKDTLRGYQASKRGGIVGVQMLDDRVVLSGQAVTVLRGELLVERR